MSQVAISGNAAGTGVFTIASPNSNSSYTLTLPAQTGTIATTADITSSANTATASDITGVNTTATVTSGTTAMTVGSGTGIVAGMYVVAQGITPGTTVSTIVGTTVTLSANAGATLSAAPVTFYSVAKLVTPGSIGGQTCRAWVNFNGVTTTTIRASFNISSVTRSAAGTYVINFTNAMPDANYAALALTQDTGANGVAPDIPLSGTYSTSAFAISNVQRTGGIIDASIVNAAVFR
jgi:hypothetical protein